jgi:hypothetical protein
MGPPSVPGPMGVQQTFAQPPPSIPSQGTRIPWDGFGAPGIHPPYSQAGPSTISMMATAAPNLDFGLSDAGHGGHGRGHVSGDMMFDPATHGLGGLGVGGAAGYGLGGMGFGMGMTDVPVLDGSNGASAANGENSDEYWNALIDGMCSAS